jgi:hypothetical protein
MTRRIAQTVSRQVHTLISVGSFQGLSDRQLRDRFVARRDGAAEAAFEVLIDRHGPMVLGICRRLLGNAQDAEDAVQATFLVLVRQADSFAGRYDTNKVLTAVIRRPSHQARTWTPSQSRNWMCLSLESWHSCCSLVPLIPAAWPTLGLRRGLSWSTLPASPSTLRR